MKSSFFGLMLTLLSLFSNRALYADSVSDEFCTEQALGRLITYPCGTVRLADYILNFIAKENPRALFSSAVTINEIRRIPGFPEAYQISSGNAAYLILPDARRTIKISKFSRVIAVIGDVFVELGSFLLNDQLSSRKISSGQLIGQTWVYTSSGGFKNFVVHELTDRLIIGHKVKTSSKNSNNSMCGAILGAMTLGPPGAALGLLIGKDQSRKKVDLITHYQIGSYGTIIKLD